MSGTNVGTRQFATLLARAGSWIPTWNWLCGIEKSLVYSTVHLRVDPDTLSEGTNPLGPYGSEF